MIPGRPWLAAFLLAGAAALQPRPSLCAASSALVPAAPNAAGVRDMGRAPRDFPVSVALTLRYRHENELDHLLFAQQDIRSPLYRHFLTNDQFDAYFAPAPEDYVRVARSLRAAGFRVRTYANRTLLDALGPAAAAETFFRTEIHRVQQSGYGVRYRNVRAGTVPLAVGDAVDTVVGLDDLMKARFSIERARGAATLAHSMALSGNLNGPDGGYSPFAIARGFVFPVQYGYDGAGRSVANVAGNVNSADVTAFLTYFGETHTGKTTRTIVEGNGQTDPSDPAVQEATLDFETIGGLAPGANFDLYILEDPIDQPGEDAYNDIVSANVDDVVNSPFGVCEQTDRAYASAAAKIIKQGAAKGITFVAASGDGGSSGCSPTGVGQNAPAVIPYVTSVGGTTYDDLSNGKYGSEVAWGGSAGGVSAVYLIPSFQAGLRGVASTKHRNVPDIGLPADPSTGTSYYLGGGWDGPIGGTSWAVSQFCALQVEVDARNNQRIGEANPTIYAVFAAGDQVFHDIVTGSNGKYNAGPGYDNVTGLGSIIGEPFANVE